jgi:hypothetical protein
MLGVQFKGNVVGVQAFGRHGDQNTERVRLDDLVHDFKVFD